jgi:hypothetical protein
MEDILTVKTNVIVIKSIDGNHLESTYKNPSYQNGRCLNLGPGIRKNNTTKNNLMFSIVSENIPNASDWVKVLFQDPINGRDIIPIVFEMKGDPIKVETKPQKKLHKFQTKISKSEHVRGDPKYDCEHYSEDNTYGQCIEAELVSKMHHLIGCHSPLISMQKEGICNETFNLTKHDDEVVGKLNGVFNNFVNDYESNSCKQPCTKYAYETKFLYDTHWRGNDNGINIAFSKKVELTETTFLIGIPSFLTGLGGAISGGRTLLWFIVSAFCVINVFQKFKKGIMKDSYR